MKIFTHWDMEGVSGIFTREHVWFWEPGTREHIAEEGRRLLMADINCSVAAALEAGVDELTVETQVERHCDVVKWIVGAGLDMDAPETTRSKRQVMP